MPRKDSQLPQELATRLSGLRGPRFWRSLNELAGTPEFESYLHREFPEAASEWYDGSSRRQFLRLMAASLALGGIAGCRPRQAERIVPYVRQPEQLVPGKPLFFASAAPLDGYGTGILVESHMGRPTKIEGNPDHPASLGATTAQTQASLLGLYDPDRSQTITYRRQIQTWDSLLTRLRPQLEALVRTQGAGLRLLTPTITSPTLVAQLKKLREMYPQARWHQFQAVHDEHERQGIERALGRPLMPIYDFRRADVVLSLDADFLGSGPGQVRYAREFADRRRVAGYRDGNSVDGMSRVYAVEATPTITGAKADHRLGLRPDQIETFARSVAAGLGVPGVDAPAEQTVPATWLSAVVDDLRNLRTSSSGAALVVAGPWQSPAVHALAHAMNVHLGAVNASVRYCEPFDASHTIPAGNLAELLAEMQQGDVKMLVILDANPIYDGPASAEFAQAMAQVPLKIHFGQYQDETSIACDWHVPALHYLESWGDIRSFDGTVAIQQPLIAPLYSGRSRHEMLAALMGEGGRTTLELVRGHWNIQADDVASEDRWQTWLHAGVVPDTAASSVPVEMNANFAAQANALSSAPAADLVVLLRPDPTVHDGQFANNGWLQELPKPFTKLTWENAALLSPATASRYKLRNGQVVRLRTDNGEVLLPSWILPGQPDGVVTAHLGYGRSRVGRTGNGLGVNVSTLRTDGAWVLPAQLEPTSETQQLASTQHHFLLDGRDLIRSGTADELREHPDHPPFASSHHHVPEASLLPKVAYEGYEWGMVIDLNTCSGCNACVVACQAENNIPVVGKEQVAMGREMHWLRIDTYYGETPENPTTHFQPLPCMHCEYAPCELVCPVAATTHSPSGINEMTYNRCVGTRYCSNNCPYKVRRFNFLHYNESLQALPILQLAQNPDVTVRSRGVMEKCTYCVQRVNAARIEAEKEGRAIRDGEVVTACQAACPTQAIQFGDLNDATSVVSQAHESPLRYGLLEDLNTKPRTTYLAEVRNPHPALKTTEAAAAHD